MGALLAAESVRRETYAKNIVAVIITLLLYWLAHSYAERAAERLWSGEQLTLGRLVRTITNAAAGRRDHPASDIADLLGRRNQAIRGRNRGPVDLGGHVVLIELTAGVRGRLAARQFIAQALIGALLGSLVIFLKVVLH